MSDLSIETTAALPDTGVVTRIEPVDVISDDGTIIARFDDLGHLAYMMPGAGREALQIVFEQLVETAKAAQVLKEQVAEYWEELRWREVAIEPPPRGQVIEMYSLVHGRKIEGECRQEWVDNGFVTHWKHRTKSPSKQKGAVK